MKHIPATSIQGAPAEDYRDALHTTQSGILPPFLTHKVVKQNSNMAAGLCHCTWGGLPGKLRMSFASLLLIDFVLHSEAHLHQQNRGNNFLSITLSYLCICMYFSSNESSILSW